MVPRGRSAEVVFSLIVVLCRDSGSSTPVRFSRGGLSATIGVLQGQWASYYEQSAETVVKLLWTFCRDSLQAAIGVLQRQSKSYHGHSVKIVFRLPWTFFKGSH